MNRADAEANLVERVVTRSLAIRVACRYASETSEAPVIIERLLSELRKYDGWSKAFPATLARARKAEDVPAGLVWQDEFVEFWQPFDAIQKEMFELADDLELVLEDAQRLDLWKAAEHDLDPPRDAQIEFATRMTRFIDVPGGRSLIAYPVRQLEIWHRNFTHWLAGAIRHLENLYSKIYRSGV